MIVSTLPSAWGCRACYLNGRYTVRTGPDCEVCDREMDAFLTEGDTGRALDAWVDEVRL